MTKKAKALITAGLRGVNVSIDSPFKKIHEKVRGVQGSFKLTTKAVELFHKYARKGKLTVLINTVISRANYFSLATLPGLAHDLGADGISLIPVDHHCGEHISMCKKAVVATPVGGTTNVIEDGKNGVLVQVNDAEVLAESILKLLSQPENRSTISKSAREARVRQFTPEEELEANLQVYQSLDLKI